MTITGQTDGDEAGAGRSAECTQSWQDVLTHDHLQQIFTVLEAAHHTSAGVPFKETMVETLARVFRVRSSTFFFGPTYAQMFTDPDPHVQGIPDHMVRNYHEHWYEKDVFALSTAQEALTRSGFVTLEDLSYLPEAQQEYLYGQLVPHGLGSAAALHLRFSDGEAILGLFDEDRVWTRPDVIAMRALAKHLQARSRGIAMGGAEVVPDLDVLLSPRQREVAELVGHGLTNAAIAERLCVTEMTVKKYISRIFEATGMTNRSMLAVAVQPPR
ncbi:response regulator transcription factor [Brevibacterium jeotgali]|uniref:Regulatory protein, luxR family n=1 Tax=Brevibacterium jeotgali TaxID=1262550 RepID=A0A2H1L4N4_9MICO|nr:helix-turn-helix transcriptional regulator [Brevibacterium jeotgali]TWC01526.1 regulatory LuxR family protein [Brevibacterium jeotgali]SMY11868.1 regulatory protein, luxR family [Brevibacterium jeotgali]